MMDAEKNTGRDAEGKFIVGNAAAKGHTNPNARKAVEISETMRLCLTPAKAKKLMNKLIKLGLAGDVRAIREAFDRVVGKPILTVNYPGENEPRLIRYSVEPPSRDAGDMPDEAAEAIDRENQGKSDAES